MVKVSGLCLALTILACSSTSVRSENGGQKHSIQCLNVVSRCHEKARSICGEGYLVTNRVRPTKQEDDVRYTLNIKCRDGITY